MMWIALHFSFHGMIGALLHIFEKRIKKPYEILRHLICGSIMGYIYFLLYSQYTFPNLLMAIIWGYSWTHWIAFIKVRKR